MFINFSTYQTVATTSLIKSDGPSLRSRSIINEDKEGLEETEVQQLGLTTTTTTSIQKITRSTRQFDDKQNYYNLLRDNLENDDTITDTDSSKDNDNNKDSKKQETIRKQRRVASLKHKMRKAQNRQKELEKRKYQTDKSNIPQRVQTRIDHFFSNANKTKPVNEDEPHSLTFGDALPPDKRQNTRFVSANINGISSRDDFAKLHILGENSDEMGIDFLGLIETNTNFDGEGVRDKCRGIIRRYWKQTCICDASSSETFEKEKYRGGRIHQPGGVMSIMSHPWASRSKATKDTSNMGRWTETTICGKRNRKVVVITAYTVCHQSQNEVSLRKTTAFTQQWHIMKRLYPGKTDLDPRKQMMIDLELRIKKIKEFGHEIIILMDANDSLQQLNSTLTDFVRKNNLTDIIVDQHGTDDEPATHSRGSQRIDYILTTPTISEYVSACGILPLNELCHSDHRALYADIDIKGYLGGDLPDNLNRHNREVHSNDPRSVRKYQEHMAKALDECNLEERVRELRTRMKQANPGDEITPELEEIDELFTLIKLECEKKSGITHKLPWSPTLKAANNTRTFWSLWLSQSNCKSDKRNFHDARQKYVNDDTRAYSALTNINRKIILSQLKKAKQKLQEARLNSRELREMFLKDRAKMALDNGDKDLHTIITAIRRAEARKRVFAKLKSLKCNTISHGINHIIVENKDGEKVTIHDPEEMIEKIIEHNEKHFSQADGTPFTLEPLKSMLGTTATGAIARDLLDGKIKVDDLELNEAVDAILRQLQKKLTSNTIDIDITTDDVIKGYQKWPEYTSTSPSGCHLGLDKAMLRYKRTQEQEAEAKESTPLFERYFNIKAFLIDSALKTGHVYKRWTKVVNALIEKLPGTPLVTKLRVIHLIESDFNLMIGILWGRRMIWAGEDNDAFNEGQGGSRPSRRTQELLLHKHLQYSILRLSKTNGSSFDNDAKSCFDRIVMPVASLAAQQLGLPPKACAIYLETLHRIKYHIKTVFGISEEYYETTVDATRHGSGQGGRGSPAVWVALSSLIMHCLERKCKGCKSVNPYDVNDKFVHWMTGFVDDVTHWCSSSENQSEEQAVCELQKTAQWWEQLLNATGGKLELSKCFFYIVQWKFDVEGVASMKPCNEFTHKVSITCSETKQNVTIIQKDISVSHKTLGVMECPNGVNTDEMERISKKSRAVVQRMNTRSLTRYEASVYYFTTYIPSITYGFVCGTANMNQMEKIEAASIPHITAAMGYTRSILNAIKFGPKSLGGMGMRKLFIEQETEKSLAIIRYLRCDRPISNIIMNYLLWAQKVAGTSKSILQDTETDLPMLNEEKWIVLPGTEGIFTYVRTHDLSKRIGTRLKAMRE